MNAWLIGDRPVQELGYHYVSEGAYDAVVIGSLTLGQLLHFRDERVLLALAEGKPVVLYTPGLPTAPGSRPLRAALASAKRELKNLGIVFTDGNQRRLVTAQDAAALRLSGKKPAPGSVLTPLAREILEGSD